MQVLVVPMLAPRSYTREDVVELQCHGGDVCVRRALQLCLEAGARLAQPGLSITSPLHFCKFRFLHVLFSTSLCFVFFFALKGKVWIVNDSVAFNWVFGIPAGEFTLRAFLNGRLDLAQAESVAQLVAAKTSVAAQSALAGIQVGSIMVSQC
jgi:tRNA modification GTPase